MYLPRLLSASLARALAGFPAILVTGPRQSGKTTFLKTEAGRDANYISFDDPLEREFALTNPHGFLERFSHRSVILDEIQYVPELLPFLKMQIDAQPERLGAWLLTGSQQFALMRDVSESLAGRIAVMELPPFSHLEHPRKDLATALWHGAYPIPSLHPERREMWLSSYLATYIERDVRQLRSIPDLRAFSQFINLAASRHGQEFQAASLSRELGVSSPTLKAWSGVLDASYIGYFLQPWFRNYGKRVIKAPKFYFFDAALVALLTRQPNPEAALAGQMGGALLEGWVVMETVKAFMAAGRKPDVYYWRSHDGLEIDLLILLRGKLLPVEIKLTASPNLGHIQPINRFIEFAGEEAIQQGIVVCQTKDARDFPGGHRAIPWHEFPDWLAERM
jgi:uncharacterized protein